MLASLVFLQPAISVSDSTHARNITFLGFAPACSVTAFLPADLCFCILFLMADLGQRFIRGASPSPTNGHALLFASNWHNYDFHSVFSLMI